MDNNDYAAILADMEAKKAALETAINGLRAALAAGALGTAGDVPPGSPPVGAPSMGASISLPRGAFLGKSVTEAIKLLLSAMRKKQTNKEIAQALRDGGLESTGNFDNYVTGGLFRLKNEGVLLRFDDGWGLSEWYPESFRTRAVEKAGSGAKRKAKKKNPGRIKRSSEKPSTAPIEGLEQRIENLLREPAMKGLVTNAEEISLHLDGVNRGAVGLALGRMAAKHKLEKADGGYRLPSGNIEQMPQPKAS